jgi:hypothetical protein
MMAQMVNMLSMLRPPLGISHYVAPRILGVATMKDLNGDILLASHGVCVTGLYRSRRQSNLHKKMKPDLASLLNNMRLF